MNAPGDSAQIPIEVELKLALAARDVGRLLRHPVFAAGAEPPAERALVSVYYDTVRRDLWQAGVALRLRRSGDAWIQTLKWGGSVEGGLHRRGELEHPVAGQVLDPSMLATPGVPARLRRLRGLRPVFATELRRTTSVVTVEGLGEVEASLDRGSIVAGTAREPICELELELRSGSPLALYRLARTIDAVLPLRPLAASKAERGYGLAGVVPGPQKAQPVAIAPAGSAADAFAAILASGLRQLQANEQGMLAGTDPEYLHQMRVGVRRMRSALSTFRAILPGERFAPIAAELRWLGTRLGPARDLDVFATELLPPFAEALAPAEVIERLRHATDRERAAANAAARTATRSRRYGRLVLVLGELLVAHDWRLGPGATEALASPVGGFADAMLERRYRKVVRRGGEIDALSVDALHELRIALKKLRYAGEFFAGLHPGARARAFRERLVGLQDSLGHINDARAMRELAERLAGADLSIAGLAGGWSACLVHAERGRLATLWRDFRRVRRYW